MALPLSQGFNGGTSGTTVTTANTGGTGQNAFDAVTIGSGSTWAFSNVHVAHGTLAGVFSTGAGGNASYVSWTTSIGSVSGMYGRIYLYLTANPATDDNLVKFQGAGNFGGGIMIASSGQLRTQNIAFGESTGGPTVATGQWIRLEWHVTAGAAGSASLTVNYYASADSGTITGSTSDTAGGFGHSGVITEVDIGWTSAHASQPSTYADSVLINTTGYPGPDAGMVSGAAALTGSGSLGAAWQLAGKANLTGSGSLGAAGIGGLLSYAALTGSGSLLAIPVGGGSAAMSGSGTFTATALVTLFQAALSGSGSLGAMPAVTYLQSAALSGSGEMSVSVPTANLDGEGTLAISGLILGYVIGLSGTGSLAVIQVRGGLVSGSGGVPAPQAMPGSSQVAVAPPGSSNWQYLGTLGQVTALTYSYACPGGCDQMTATVMVPASYRNQMFNPGWKVRITRGGHQVWTGKLDEPAPSPSGWTLSAVGTGNRGTDFTARYTTAAWPSNQPDEIINQAISRGLPWVNPGQNASPYAGQFWFGQQVDPAAQTVAAFLSLLCTRGGLTWYVNSQPGGMPGDDLNIFPLPTAATRLLVCTTPVPRTLGGDINSIYIRYTATADDPNNGVTASYALTLAQNAQSVAAHGVLETYVDLSDVGVMSAGAAQAAGNSVLAAYQRASFAGPFTASYGQLLTTGGVPVDPGTDQAGTVAQLILTDYGYGGEVTPNLPVSFIVGGYSWDDFAQVATITPFVTVDESLSGMLSAWNTAHLPGATVAGG